MNEKKSAEAIINYYKKRGINLSVLECVEKGDRILYFLCVNNDSGRKNTIAVIDNEDVCPVPQ